MSDVQRQERRGDIRPHAAVAPSKMATASLGVALATLALAIAGALLWLLDLAPLLAQGI